MLLLASKNIREVAVGCYLRHLTHQVSLTKAGISKRAIARLRRVKVRRFKAPALDASPLINFNRIESLAETPWVMLEISSDHRMAQIMPLLEAEGKRIFGKTPAQIFAPTDTQGDLLMGYIFARSLRPPLTYKLRTIRGITEISATCDDEGKITKVTTVPDAEIQPLIHKAVTGNVQVPQVRVGDFVQILTGEAARYCGVVTEIKGINLHITVSFPSGRVFHVIADPTVVRPLTASGVHTFWGIQSN
jgi:transcription antitermination factor NusG